MKKITVILLTLALALSLAACDRGRGASTGSDLSWEEIERLAGE